MKTKAINWREAEARDKRTTAFHEAGHCVAAKHFGLDWCAFILRAGKPTREDRAYTGQTRYTKTTAFRVAVLAWCGPIAEHLAELPPAAWPKECMEMFEDYQDGFFERDNSATDTAGINRHRQRGRALKTAWNIIVKRRAEVTRIAHILLTSGTASAAVLKEAAK